MAGVPGSPVAWPAVPEFQTSPGMRDILAPESGRWRRFVEVFADVVEPAGYGQVVSADARGPRRVPARRRGHRRRHQGDVRLRRQGRPPRRPAPGADGLGVPGVRPAPPADAVEGVVRRAATSATRSRSAAATASSTRSTSRCSASTTRTSTSRSSPSAGASSRRSACARSRCCSTRSASRPTAPATSTPCARHFEAAPRRAQRRRAARRSPATRCACSTPSAGQDAALIAAAPPFADFLSDAAAAHFERVRAGLDALGIPYRVEPRLVRGLDYYLRTTFEYAGGTLEGAQNALGGGGRYDGLVEALGGPPTPGIGFALGLDRTLLACDDEGVFPARRPRRRRVRRRHHRRRRGAGRHRAAAPGRPFAPTVRSTAAA